MRYKLTILYTGEPRSIKKGLIKRNEFFQINKLAFESIETRYLICYLKESNKKKKELTLNNLKYLYKDDNLKSVNIQERTTDNIYKHILQQKRDLLTSCMNHNKDANSVIVLTRTDWFFTSETLRLIKLSMEENYVVSPGIPFNRREKKGLIYYPFNDHFMAIPMNLLREVISALNHAIEEISLLKPNTNKAKSEIHSGNGEKRFGNGPEDALGYGFAKNNLNKKHLIEPIVFSFKPSMLDASRHNLIRDDALKWMQFSTKQKINLSFIYIKPILLGKLKRIFSKLNL